jgi:hypothetical protein
MVVVAAMALILHPLGSSMQHNFIEENIAIKKRKRSKQIFTIFATAFRCTYRTFAMLM